jgi:3-oxoacyl-[acyl-carrier-protein] synthase II
LTTRRAAVTGLGAVSPFGVGLEALWTGLVEGRSAIRPITRFDTADYRYKVAGEVPAYEFKSPSAFFDVTDRADQYLFTAAAEALADAGLEPIRREDHEPKTSIDLDTGRTGEGWYLREGAGLRRAAVVVGTNFGPAETIQSCFAHAADADRGVQSRLFAESSLGHAAAWLSTWIGPGGPVLVLSLSCSSGASSVGVGLGLIRRGAADRVVAGGYDSLSEFAWSGLSILRTMTPGALRPFDARRDGTIFSEGAGVLVLEEMEAARARGTRVYAECAGSGINNNAFHMTAPDKWGGGLRRAIEAALADARLAPQSVDFVVAHGTGTRYNDAAETQALKAALGRRAADIPVVSIKSMIGHTMGASSSIEEVAALLAMSRRVVPPTINYAEPDPECDLDYVTEGPRDGVDINVAVCDSSGLGGSNAVVVFRKV